MRNKGYFGHSALKTGFLFLILFLGFTDNSSPPLLYCSSWSSRSNNNQFINQNKYSIIYFTKANNKSRDKQSSPKVPGLTCFVKKGEILNPPQQSGKVETRVLSTRNQFTPLVDPKWGSDECRSLIKSNLER